MSEYSPPEVTDAAALSAAGGAPASADVNALLARITAMEDQVKAAQAAAEAAQKAAEPKPPTLAEVAVNVADAAARHAFQLLADHLGI